MSKTVLTTLVLGATLAALAMIGGVAIGQTSAQHSLARVSASMTEQAQRPCIFPAGGWTTVDCSNVAAASSAALNKWSRYIVQCTDDSYIATGTAASGQDADSSDGYLPEGSWLELMTTDSIIYYSCLNINGDNDCRHIECR